jgi:hypothetical protein
MHTTNDFYARQLVALVSDWRNIVDDYETRPSAEACAAQMAAQRDQLNASNELLTQGKNGTFNEPSQKRVSTALGK